MNHPPESNPPLTYRQKPVIVEAIQYDGTYASAIRIIRHLGAAFLWDGRRGGAHLQAGKNEAQGWVPVPVGYWVIKGGEDDFWSIDPDVFAETHEPSLIADDLRRAIEP